MDSNKFKFNKICEQSENLKFLFEKWLRLIGNVLFGTYIYLLDEMDQVFKFYKYQLFFFMLYQPIMSPFPPPYFILLSNTFSVFFFLFSLCFWVRGQYELLTTWATMRDIYVRFSDLLSILKISFNYIHSSTSRYSVPKKKVPVVFIRLRTLTAMPTRHQTCMWFV